MLTKLNEILTQLKGFESTQERLSSECGKIRHFGNDIFVQFLKQSLELFSGFPTIENFQKFEKNSSQDFIPSLRNKRLNFDKKNKLLSMLMSCAIKTNETKMHENFQDYISEFQWQFKEFFDSLPKNVLQEVKTVKLFLEENDFTTGTKGNKNDKDFLKVLKMFNGFHKAFAKKEMNQWKDEISQGLDKLSKSNVEDAKSSKKVWEVINDVQNTYKRITTHLESLRKYNEQYGKDTDLLIRFIMLLKSLFDSCVKKTEFSQEKFIKKTQKLEIFFEKSSEKLETFTNPPKSIAKAVKKGSCISEIQEAIKKNKTSFAPQLRHIKDSFEQLKKLSQQNEIKDKGDELVMRLKKFLNDSKKYEEHCKEIDEKMTFFIKKLNVVKNLLQNVHEKKMRLQAISAMHSMMGQQIMKANKVRNEIEKMADISTSSGLQALLF